MSMANIPDINPVINIDREDVVNILIASVAFEELGLAHLINSTAEELQAVLGTLRISGLQQTPPSPPIVEITSINDLLDLNESVRRTLRDVIKKEIILEFKLDDAISLLNMLEEDEDNGGEENEARVGAVTLINQSAALAARMDLVYFDNAGDRIVVPGPGTEVVQGQPQTINPGNFGVPQGARFTILAQILGNGSIEGNVKFIYEPNNAHIAKFTLSGTTQNPSLTFEGIS